MKIYGIGTSSEDEDPFSGLKSAPPRYNTNPYTPLETIEKNIRGPRKPQVPLRDLLFLACGILIGLLWRWLFGLVEWVLQVCGMLVTSCWHMLSFFFGFIGSALDLNSGRLQGIAAAIAILTFIIGPISLLPLLKKLRGRNVAYGEAEHKIMRRKYRRD